MSKTKRKPGDFRATCKLKHPVRYDQVPDEIKPLVDAGILTPGRVKSRWDKKLGNVVDLACSFETTDTVEFERHMLEVHGKKPTLVPNPADSTQAISNRARGKWRGPKAQPEGTPVKPKDRESAKRLRDCLRCGLVAEVGELAADVLWWTEHERMCVGAEAGAA